MYTCKVCGKKYKDTWEHVLKRSKTMSGLLVPVDEAHAKLIKELEQSMEPKVGKCFCGGTVTTIGCGEDSWSTNCIECDMLYDED